MNSSLWLAVLAGIGIAAACGLRAFLPLLGLGLAARAGLIELEPHARWLSGNPALLALGLATVLEIAGDKVPLVDHALDLAGSVLRPIAAAFGAWSVLVHGPAPVRTAVALALGPGAFLVHALKAKLRIGSTAVTLGHANPLLSVAEDGTAAGLVGVAIFAPILMLAVLLIAGLAMLALRRRRRAAS